MSDNKVLKQIIESRENQKLRDTIKQGNIDEKSKEKLDNMTETEKDAFMRKGWING